MKKTIFTLLLTFSISFFFSNAIALEKKQSAYDPMKSMECMVTTDFYIVHLTSYQPPKPGAEKRHKFKPFCKELPEAGPSFLAIDLMDKDTRTMPIGMQVFELIDNPEGGEMINGKSLAVIPPKLHKTGVAQIQVDFPKPGHYVLVASIGDDMFADKIRIPLRVGIGSAFDITVIYPYLFFILIAAIVYGIYRFFVYRYNLKNSTEQKE